MFHLLHVVRAYLYEIKYIGPTLSYHCISLMLQDLHHTRVI